MSFNIFIYSHYPGCFALLYILYQLAWESRRHAASLGNDVSKCFFLCGTLTAVLWIIYPIAWGVCEGGNIISPDSEAVFYGVLDFMAKPIFGALLLFGHRKIDPARLGLRIKDYDGDHSVNGHEKTGPDNGPGTGLTAPVASAA